MRVLQICSKPPLPEIDGGCKAMNNITQGLLLNGVEVKLLTISTYKHPFKKEDFSKDYVAKTGVENIYIKTKVNVGEAFLNLFSKKSYNVERFYVKEFEDLIVRVVAEKDFDIVLIESLYVSKYINIIRKVTKAKIVYRAHNIESEIWDRNASKAKGLRKIYLKLLARKLKKYETDVLNQFDGIAAITEKDKSNFIRMGCKIPIEVFPFGIDILHYETNGALEKKSVFHLGSMDWHPNVNGLKWFFRNVWNEVVKNFPDVEFTLAGKDIPDWLMKHEQKNVNVIGSVKNANDFINQHSIMIVPLFVASGMRIKIIEAMALQKLVVATSIAAEGIAYKDGENIVIADTIEDFTKAIIKYLSNDKEQKRIAINGRELVESSYDNLKIVNSLVMFFKQIMN